MYLGPYIKSTVTDPEFFLKQSDEEKGGGGYYKERIYVYSKYVCIKTNIKIINKLHMYMSFSLFSLLFFKIYFKI